MEKTFELRSLKVGMFGVDCKYRISETDDNGSVTENEYHVKVSRPMHPDFEALFSRDLTAIATEIFNNTEYSAELEMGVSKIVPTGIAFAGKNDNIGISIIGNIETAFGRVTFKTPRIKYKTSEKDVAAKLTVFADKIVEETHAYLFEDKTAEMGVFGE